MSGSATNRGGVRFEFRPDVDASHAWRAAMRNHDGYGATVEEAASALVGSVERELATAKAGAASLLAPSAEPPETDRQLRKWQQQAAPGCMRYGSEEDCDPACAEWCALPAESPETDRG